MMDNRYLSWIESDDVSLGASFLRYVQTKEFDSAKKVVQEEMSRTTPTIAKSNIYCCCREAISLELYDIVDVLISIPEWIDDFYLDKMIQDERTLMLLAERCIIDQEEFLMHMREMMLNYLKTWENPKCDLEWVIERFHSLDRYFVVSKECKREITRLLRAYYPYFLGEKSRPSPPPDKILADGCPWCGMYRSCPCQSLPQDGLLEQIEKLIRSLKVY